MHRTKLLTGTFDKVAKAAGITAMPTFHFYLNSKKVDELRGANPGQLEALIKKHANGGSSGAAAAASGASSSAASGPVFGIVGYQDLTSTVNLQQVECLNQSDQHTVRSIFTKGSDQYLESDCDEQLMISVQFHQPVKVCDHHANLFCMDLMMIL